MGCGFQIGLNSTQSLYSGTAEGAEDSFSVFEHLMDRLCPRDVDFVTTPEYINYQCVSVGEYNTCHWKKVLPQFGVRIIIF